MITVIVPTFNRASVLPRALESVRAQAFRDWELLVCDDGSTDTTVEIVKNFATEDPRIRLLSQPNGGVSRARNRAAAEARGEWLAFLDSDDEWLPHKLSRQLELAGRFPLIHGEEIWVRNGVRVNPLKKHAKTGGRIFRRCVDLCCISPSATLIRADLFRTLSGFREDFPVCEDYDLWLKVAARHDVGFIEEPLIVKYGGHADQLSRAFKAMDYFRVKALEPFLSDASLPEDDRAYVAAAMIEKCEILLNGYRKHGRTEHYDEVEGWLRKALTQAQSAHSTAERRPRSDANLIL